MTPVVLSLPGNEVLGRSLAESLGAELGTHEMRHFPDGETYLRIDSNVAGRAVILVCTLDRPDPKFLPLLFMAGTARDLGAATVGLVCPYLPYMRQDKQFRAGEAVSSVYFAAMLAARIDWLVTVDPHLHRRASLDEIFSVPSIAVHAAPLLSSWIKENLRDPFVIGPDSESEQWVASVASGAAVPYAVLQKIRRGDRDVEISTANLQIHQRRTPVLVDDIISTGSTMMAAIGALKNGGWDSPVCIGIHAVFAEDAYSRLRAAGANLIVTCNTILHPSNRIDVAGIVAAAVHRLVG
jgi:ribose-phosphate pyrophosphokinase